jgi:uncharacterized protein YndB with AHSA1/START domain
MSATAPAHTGLGVVITRVFDAPRELVWEAWTNPKVLAQWWGPRGFTSPVCEVSLRVGGALCIHMRAPNGVVYPMRGVFQEIVKPEKLVFTNIAVDNEDRPVLDGVTTVTFADLGGKTELTVKTWAVAVVDYATAYLAGMEAGWTMSIDKLVELLAKPRT